MLGSIAWVQTTLQIVVVAAIFVSFVLSPIIGWGLYLYLLTTRFWWFCFLYLSWLYYDRHTPESGGRPISWIQNSRVWKQCINYFPSELALVPDFDLNPNKNYLVCLFPHGILPLGPYANITNGVSKFKEIFPNFRAQMAIINLMLLTPFMRELILGMGVISCSSKSLNYILSRRNGGHIVNLSPGGAMEAYYSRPGQYCFYVKNRKGFIKTALRNGAALVPAITFGEVDLFEQIENQKIRALQEFIRKTFGFVPLLFYGTGFFFSFGLIPRKKPLMTVLGKPIEVSKVESPTQQEVDGLHKKFVDELVSLFDVYKHRFLDKDEDQDLVLK